MTEMLAFVLAVIALLAVPGPTNTLLAASGAAIGLRPSLRLIPAEISGYLVAIGCLLAVLQPLVASHPLVPVASKLLAAAYIAWTAVRLWRDGGAKLMSVPVPASTKRLLLTTLLNPKALIFAFVIFPHSALATLWPHAIIFSALVAAVGCGWILLGSLIARSAAGTATPKRISRVAAIALSVFAILIASSAVAGVVSQ
jgi:threonine/homoserine/homoserine lactone efflux protein